MQQEPAQFGKGYMIKLYSASYCPNCPAAKRKLDKAHLDYTIVDVETPEGRQEAKDNGVRGLPTVIAISPSNEVLELTGDAINIERLLKHMDVYD